MLTYFLSSGSSYHSSHYCRTATDQHQVLTHARRRARAVGCGGSPAARWPNARRVRVVSATVPTCKSSANDFISKSMMSQSSGVRALGATVNSITSCSRCDRPQRAPHPSKAGCALHHEVHTTEYKHDLICVHIYPHHRLSQTAPCSICTAVHCSS